MTRIKSAHSFNARNAALLTFCQALDLAALGMYLFFPAVHRFRLLCSVLVFKTL